MVAGITERAATRNVFRQAMNVVSGIRGDGVEIPYEVTAHTAAIVQGAFGSNKEVRDFTLGTATATLYTIAQIVDVGNQLLRRSEGAAEQLVRRRLGKSFGIAESRFVVSGTGSGQPNGILTAFLAHGDPAEYKTTLSSEPRAATIGRAISAVGARGEAATAVILHPTDFAETVIARAPNGRSSFPPPIFG
jgi:HK97 family phage major capsid protein